MALLYASDAGGEGEGGLAQAPTLLELLIEAWELTREEARKLAPAVGEFGGRLCLCYFEHRNEVDQHIDRLSEGWTIGRMPIVDRSILRMAMTELLFFSDIPVGATIDEAVELAKEYGTAESARFLNGILGTMARELARREPPSGAEEAG